jgi:oligopeptide transport system substrate-binding protein
LNGEWIVIRFLLLLVFLSTTIEAAPLSPNTLHISLASDPTTLDPRKSGDFVTSTLLFLLYQGLTTMQKDGSISLALAESYEISPDQKTYTFHIRKNCYWSSGEEITAYDFESSWKKILDPSFPSICAQLLYPIKNAEAAAQKKVPIHDVKISAKDSKTLVVELENPTPYFLTLTSFCVYFPLPKDHNASSTTSFSGPFQLVTWKHHNEILVKKNPSFWNASSILFENIHISIVRDENTAYHMFEKGELDWIGTPASPIPFDTLAALKKSKDFHSFPVGATTFCAFNVEMPPLNNLSLRKALSLAMNRKDLTTHITQLGEIVATGYIPPIIFQGENKNLVEDHNKEKANMYLQRALEELHILRQNLTITLTYNTSSLQKKLAEALKEQWEKELGIVILLQCEEEKMWREHLYKHEFQMSLALWFMQYNDPMNIFERFKYKNHPKNYSNWECPAFIDLVNQIQSAKTSKERNAAIEGAEACLSNAMPFTPIYHHKYSILVKPYVQNIEIGPIGDLHFEKAYIKK